MSQQPNKFRRTPNFTRFLLTGALVGLLVGLVLGTAGPGDARYEASAGLGLLGMLCAGLGVLVGGLLAVLLDKRP